MEIGNEIIEFLSNKVILVTGATGFLAKVLVEKILRVQPNVKKMYLLIRAKNNKSAMERLDEITGLDLFHQVLRQRQGSNFGSFISERLAPVDGDTSLSNLGLKDDDEIHKKIDVIIHAAALTRFYERYDTALAVNTFGAKNVLDFAKTCPKLQILVHVSTAYVTLQKSGVIPETLCQTFSKVGLDLDVEKKLIDKKLNALTRKGVSTLEVRDSMRHLGHQRAKSYGWPNVYTFTKTMGEMLIWEHKGDLPVVIIRPTMICSTYKEPFPGWVEGVGSINMLSILYGKGLADFTLGDSNAVFDLIPVDMVANSIAKAMVVNANQPGLTIYHVGSSMRNPITLSKLVDLNFQYFNKNPWINGDGNTVRIKKGKIVKSKLYFLMLVLQHIPKLMVSKLAEKASCHKSKIKQNPIEMQLKVTAKMAMFYKHYTFFAGIFDDTNTEKLRTTTSENDMDGEGFNFNPKYIDWEHYLLNSLIPSTVKYLF